MKLLAAALVIAAAAPTGEAAESKAPALQLKPKAAIANLQVHRHAPFTLPTGEPELHLIPKRDARQEASRSSCSGDRSLCYDPSTGRIVYKPARALMPGIPGLQPENISVRRDRIVFRYSF